MNTTELKNFKGYKSFGEMFVKEAKKKIEEEKKKGIIYFEENSHLKKPIKIDL